MRSILDWRRYQVNITVDMVKERVRALDFIDVRIDRLAHLSGFRRMPVQGELNSDALRRSIGPGSNEELIFKENLGVSGPVFVEVGYGNQTIRVRMYRGYALIRVWDIYTYWELDRLEEWTRSFTKAVNAALDDDELIRTTWRREHKQ
jgi:hypothetical protein